VVFVGMANHVIDVLVKERLTPVKQVNACEMPLHLVDDFLECLKGHYSLFPARGTTPCWTERAPQITDIRNINEKMGWISGNPVLLFMHLMTGKVIVCQAEYYTMQSCFPKSIGDWEASQGRAYIGMLPDEPDNLILNAFSHKGITHRLFYKDICCNSILTDFSENDVMSIMVIPKE